MASSYNSANFLIESRLAEAARGDARAFYELGIAYSAGGCGVEVDLVQAHKWFNLAAMRGCREAIRLRRELAELMSAAEVSAAQRAARDWLGR